MSGFVKNTWYPLGWARDIKHELARRRVIGEDLVVYRLEDDRVAALEDACPHRLAPLSIGRLKGDHIECGYHGMTFDCAGTCVRVPGQERIPPGAKVRAYPTAENMGMVWVWMGEPAAADTTKIFNLPQYHDPAFTHVEGDALPVKAGYLNLADNLCDPSHVAYVHQSTLATTQHAEVPVSHEVKDGVVTTWRWIIGGPLIPLFQGLKDLGDDVDRWHYYHYHAPCVALIDFGSARTGTGAPEGNRGDCIQMYACHFITPVDERSSIQHWLCVKNTPATPELDAQLIAGLRCAFDEDKLVLEAIQVNEEKPRSWKPIKIALDGSSVRMRRVVDEMFAAET